MSLHPAAVSAAALLVAACSTHPLPQDFAGYSTYEIVRRIRCEAREALKDKLRVTLADATQDPVAQDVARRMVLKTINLNAVSKQKYSKQTSFFIDYFRNAAIAYSFTFDMTEVNDFGGSTSFLKPIFRGTESIGLSAGLNRSRNNTRTFTIADKFGELIDTVKDDYCEGKFAPEKISSSLTYPITGRIGLAEMIDNFVDMSLFGSLSDAKGDAPTIADSLEFVTRVYGSATPRIELAALRNDAALVGANAGIEVSRTDKHRVIIGMSLPVKAKDTVNLDKNEFPSLLVTESGDATQRQAIRAVDQVLQRDRLIITR
ncbi:hypothetical protein ACWIGM_11660 [Bosea sp. NPDC055332]